MPKEIDKSTTPLESEVSQSSTTAAPLVPAQTLPLPSSMTAASNLINASYRRTATSIMETAYYCYEARKIWKGQIKKLVAMLDFDAAQFSRYCNAYENEILRANIANLPASLKTMSTLRKLPSGVLQKCFNEKKITSGTTDKEARALVLEHVPRKERAAVTAHDSDGTDEVPSRDSPPIVPGGNPLDTREEPIAIIVNPDIPEKHPLAFRKWLKSGRDQFNVEVRNWDLRSLYGNAWVLDSEGDTDAEDRE